jgi:hypothetical protein
MTGVTAVLSDLDSTIADSSQRHHLMPRNCPGNTWEDYAFASADDVPFPGVVRALQLHAEHHQIIIISGRPPSALAITQEWLRRHEVPFAEIHLVGDEIRHSSKEEAERFYGRCKAEVILRLIAAGTVPLLMYEDHLVQAGVITELTGVPVITVTPGYTTGE